MRLSLAIAAVVLAASPALAGATGWAELAPQTRVRLITTDRLAADGTTLAAIELEMPPGTKTYWRVPGETGIPTELDLTGSTGIAGHRLLWPYPQLDTRGGYTDFVYYGSVVIPIELTVDADAPRLDAALLMGICSDICVPATARFSLQLDFGRPDPGQDIRIAQAMAMTPVAWTGPGGPVGDPVFDAAEGVLEVPVDSAVADPDSLIVDAMDTGHLFGAPKKSPETGIVAVPLIGGGDGAGLEGTSVRLLFMTRDGPYEVSRRVGASTPE